MSHNRVQHILGKTYPIWTKDENTLKKINLSLENYLSTFPPQHHKAVTRLRIGADKLAIERGRYMRPPNTFRKQNMYSPIEDECHFILECKAYVIQQNCFQNKSTMNANKLNNLSINYKCAYLMGDRGQITHSLYVILLYWECGAVRILYMYKRNKSRRVNKIIIWHY